MKLAIIPARGGSKRIPRKNIRPFRGKPIIAYSIEAALASGCFDRVIISTDDEEIAEVAREHGAEVPFTRPADLSDDHTPTIPVIQHAIRWTEEHGGESPEAVCCLYATAPFLTGELVRKGCQMLEDDLKTEFVFTAAKFSFPIYRALEADDEGYASMLWPQHELTRSQDLPDAFHDAGQFYWGRRDAYLSGRGFFNARSRLLVLPPDRVQDIDTLDDWRLAEMLYDLAQY